MSYWEEGLATTMAVVVSGERSRLLLHPCFQSLLFFSKSPFFLMFKGGICSWVVRFFFGKERGSAVACYGWFLGRGKVNSFSSPTFIPLLIEMGVFRCWLWLFVSPF